jgi:hypothetical protein
LNICFSAKFSLANLHNYFVDMMFFITKCVVNLIS